MQELAIANNIAPATIYIGLLYTRQEYHSYNLQLAMHCSIAASSSCKMASSLLVYVVISTLAFLSAALTPHKLVLAMAAPARRSSAEPLETYIVHVPARLKPAVFASHKQWHASMISDAIDSSAASVEERMLYSYENSLQGFAVRLTPQEAANLRQTEGVGTLFKDRSSKLHTTRTPSFLGLSPTSGLLGAAKGGEDVIVGVLDTGVWPERGSYSDDGLSPIPARWKGTCESSSSFDASMACNRKLIGARIFFKGYEANVAPINETIEFKSPRDSDGHGSHTSSTAAGHAVPYANLSGFAPGTASGVAPLSRLAIYKVCWLLDCFESDILAAFDAAISDGVDVLSLSIGSGPVTYSNDTIAIGSFLAMSKGIITVCSAGNSGPASATVTNVAPWIFTIAASSIDRDFPANAVLGNGQLYKGDSLFKKEGYEPEQLPLIYAGNAAVRGGNATLASLCGFPVLDPNVVKGKIVFCDRGGGIARVAKGAAVKAAGGAGMILGNDAASGEELVADTHALPATLVGHQAALAIKQYINSTSSPTASLDFEGTTKLNNKPAPVVTAFSSRGPNPITPEILKPDVTAPGLNILAAWTGAIGPTEIPGDTNFVEFNIISGTSMSCPHVAGATALLKAARPTWSPAAIKSALMTSAVTVDNTGKTITESSTAGATDPTAYGAGHIHPNAALNPGLIYDITQQDYVDFLCTLGYTETMLSVFLESTYDCSKAAISKPGDLNYPSFSAVYYQNQSSSYTTTLTRTVTNVGAPNSTYTVSIVAPRYVNVSVEPTTLTFACLDEKLSYALTLSAGMMSFIPEVPQEALSFGSITWSDGLHVVQSPISFMWQG